MRLNLPVIVLKSVILLPNNDIRFEVDTKKTSNLIDLVEMFHDNKLLVVSQNNPLEENPNINQLPKVGVIGVIKSKIDLPNGKTRIVISGQVRASIVEYVSTSKEDDIIESFLTPIPEQPLSSNETQVLIRKLHKELENYILKVSYVSNSVLNVIESIDDLSKITDIIAPQLPNDFKRLKEYLKEFSPIKRTEMILEDIYKELEMFNMEKALDKRIRHELETSQREMILKEKIRIIKEELGETTLKDEEVAKMRCKAESIYLPPNIRKKVEKEIGRFELLNEAAPDINVTKTYIDWLLELPWNNFTKDNDNFKEVKKFLDESHFGLEEIKTRIIEYLAVNKYSTHYSAPILCLIGPPGVGKTTLSKSIAEAVGKNFVKMSVGGLNDESEIRGNRRTYLGANPGRIIQSMKKAGSNNPVFLIDEIDKIGKDHKGDPSAALLEVLDPNQKFSDNFIEEEYDLSHVMFIATANYKDQIPEALKDRLEIIEIKGYTELEKLDIAKKYLIPIMLKRHNLEGGIEFDDEVILYIINHYTKEAGVRELKRQITKVIRKIVTSIVTNNIKLNGLRINVQNIEKYLGYPKYLYELKYSNKPGIVNALTYTDKGGETASIEVSYFRGNGQFILTGNLGETLKESAMIALSYIKTNLKKFDIDYNILKDIDIHIHMPSGGIPKDGPSAGIAITTALLSVFKGITIKNSIAFTGEITLKGSIRPVGNVKDKIIGSIKNNINTIFIPFENINDINTLPPEILEKVEIIPVKEYMEIYNYIMRKKDKK